MSLAVLVRWSGLAGLMGGILWMAATFLLWYEDSAYAAVFSSVRAPLPHIALLLFLVGLVGLHARHSGSFGRVARAGLALGFVWLALALLGSIADLPSLVAAADAVGITVLVAGMVVVGLVAVRPGELAGWGRAVPLVTGSVGVLMLGIGFAAFFTPAVAESGSAIWTIRVTFTLFGAGWVLLGYSLWGASNDSLEDRLEWLAVQLSELAFFKILEYTGRLTIVVALIIYFAEAPAREANQHQEAWQTIESSRGEARSEERVEAMQALNEDGESLVSIPADRADLSGIDLTNADLQDASFLEADLTGADLAGADFEQANLREADFGETPSGEGADLESADLEEASLQDATLTGTNLRGAALAEAHLSGADLSGADLRDAVLVEADLSRANLVGAELRGADFEDANLSGADIRRGTDLRGAENLTPDQLEAAKGDESTLLPDGFERPRGWSEEEAEPLPERGPVPSGQHATEEFGVPFVFGVGDGWEVEQAEVEDLLRMEYAGESAGGLLAFLNAREVYDPERPGATADAPETAARMVEWFRDHRHLEAGEPAPVKVGDVSGEMFEVEVASVPEDIPPECADPCVPLFRTGDGTPYAIPEDQARRVVVLEAGGETVVVNLGTDDGFLPTAQEMLDTVRWNGARPDFSSGAHTETTFEPNFSYSIGEGWQPPYSLPDAAVISRGDGNALNFLDVREVYDPENPQGVSPAPEDLVAWFRDHGYLDVGRPEPVEVGGASGMAFDVDVVSVPLAYPPECTSPCVPLFRKSNGEIVSLLDGHEGRVVVVEDVGDGRTVTMLVQGPQDGYGEFLPRAEGVLRTVEWGG